MKGLPIRVRLTLWYAASLTVLIAAFGLLIDGLMHTRLLARTDAELDEELHELALEVELARDGDDLRRQLELRFGRHETFDFVVQTPAGAPVFLSRNLRDTDAALAATRGDETPRFDGAALAGLGECRIGVRRADGPTGPLSIAVVLPLGRQVAELHDLRLLLATVGPLVVLVSIGGGYWLARRSLQPVDRMTAAADRITAERLSERLDVANPEDELGRLAATLNRMIDRLQRALDDMRQFTADAAHELRTPLAVLRSTAEIALRHPRATGFYEESLQAIVEEAERLTLLSNQLLLLAREDAGLDTEARERLDLAELLREAAADVEPLAEQKEIALSCDCAVPAPVLGDRGRLRRVFVNLLENAVKYTPPGGEVAVTLKGDDRTAGGSPQGTPPAGPEVEVIVRDTGIGIAAEHLPHVFERFFRADASHNRETGGTGLGLAICRAIVASHHGRIAISSEPGAGTEVRVTLPRTSGDLPAGLPLINGDASHAPGRAALSGC